MFFSTVVKYTSLVCCSSLLCMYLYVYITRSVRLNNFKFPRSFAWFFTTSIYIVFISNSDNGMRNQHLIDCVVWSILIQSFFTTPWVMTERNEFFTAEWTGAQITSIARRLESWFKNFSNFVETTIKLATFTMIII